ncbi:hypothetical protein ESY86_16995 [Subsaximicrobium wynnwilliamsii]|uniref:Uncharacterized protein n=1 Tax=Subsaximicrobium wynnwilliamsii TaxID=291179 RepID=A0A5C6ZF48_9FLAO|nr:hypothetical protein [Subsaximicrobium wynnwilliamsii]TXD83269.1 hypothetical protein ESY87_09865 [Subsaximicrobium wynnwilliamsii]TXD87368.1 hypothetical protein ESY86_16995 [Subsaximicrobium wynnwilliamsii]TXE03292.1 hypothetical protein ESY88_08160 [Subsaximicrobium wynnwilliamsii]
MDRDDNSREKEFLGNELARKTTESNDLQNRYTQREADVELRQIQLRKDFELLASKLVMLYLTRTYKRQTTPKFYLEGCFTIRC